MVVLSPLMLPQTTEPGHSFANRGAHYQVIRTLSCILPLFITQFLFCATHSALTERVNLRTDPAIYADGGKKLLEFINARENVAAASGRFDYGKLEYPLTLSLIAPDSATGNDTFPPGRFHQDSFSGNPNLTSFYVGTLVPNFFQAPSSFFFHLDNSTLNDDAAMNLDATLLALLSHR